MRLRNATAALAEVMTDLLPAEAGGTAGAASSRGAWRGQGSVFYQGSGFPQGHRMDTQVALERSADVKTGQQDPAPDTAGAAQWTMPPEHPRVLLVSSSWWAFPALLGIEMAARGLQVEAVCPRGHPLRKTAAVRRFFPYRGGVPLRSLRMAIAECQPALIIPCDDRAVRHLHALHAAAGADTGLAELIEASLGSRHAFDAVGCRARIIDIARAAGTPAPEMMPLDGLADLRRAIDTFGLPVVLKVDGSWGGLGVVVARTQDRAEAAFRTLSARLSAAVALKRLIVDRDSFSLQPWLQGAAPRVNAQRFAAGRPANCAVACWQGEVLACTCVEVLHARTAVGASTVVRRIDNQLMAESAALLVRELGLSGLCGFDFLIDDATGAVHLLECNARATPLCHLDFGPGQDPLAALMRHVFRGRVSEADRRVSSDTVAFFPQFWLLEPASPLFKTCHHDVPWSEPDLVRELVKTPWPQRGLFARIADRTRRRHLDPIWIKDAADRQPGSGPATQLAGDTGPGETDLPQLGHGSDV
jgi:hypothetical protein